MGTKIPQPLIWAVVSICVAPLLLNWVGVDFASHTSAYTSDNATDTMFYKLSGAFTHTILEWSAFMAAILTVLLAFTHYRISGDVTTPVIAVALFMSGCMDAFHTLAADRLIEAVADNRNLIPFTWAISRLFSALIMIVGVGMFLVRIGKDRRMRRTKISHRDRRDHSGYRFVVWVSLVFGFAAYMIISICATSERLPQTMYPDSLITRPWDIAPLLLFLFAGLVVFPRFYRRAPSLFSHALLVAVIPEVATQLYMAFGSAALFDNAFNIAHFLKVVSYLVPFGGLCLDYVQTHLVKEAVVAEVQEANKELEHEIAERKEAEKALRESEMKFRSVAQSANDAIVSADQDGKIVSWNKGAQIIFGYEEEEVLGKSLEELMPEKYRKAHTQGLDRFLRTGEKKIIGKTIEIVGRRKGGHEFPIEISISSWEVKKEVFVAGIIRDITKRKITEERLQNSEAQQRMILEAAVNGIITIDTSGIVQLFNPAAEDLFGYRSDEVVGRNINMLMPEPYHTEHDGYLRHYLETGERKIIGSGREVVGRRKDGSTFPMDLAVSEMQVGGAVGFVGLITDITERKQVERELIAAMESAETAKREADQANTAKSEFLASMSHEIRTPMNAILGMAELLSETELNAEQKRYIGTFSSAGETLLAIINDILDLSKIESGQLKLEQTCFNLGMLLDQLGEIMAVRAHEKNLELAFRLPDTLPDGLIGDPTRLRQIIVNLVGNAIKFTEQGEVVVEVALERRSTDRIDLTFSVRDTGIGIEPGQLDKIFQSFTQADSSTTRKYGGTGLGLTISQLFVEMMGGRIWVESDIGAGSVFFFTIECGIAAGGGCAGSQPARSIDMNGLQALVVDDNKTNREILRKTLERWGAVVTEANSAAKGLDILRGAVSAGTPVDLVLLDYQMPNMNGLQMAEEIQRDPSIRGAPLILASSGMNGVGAEMMREAGVSACLTKPVKRGELQEAIGKIMGQEESGARREPGSLAPGPVSVSPMKPLRVLLVEDNVDNRNLILAYLKKTPHQVETAGNGKIAVEMFKTNIYDIVLMDMEMPVMDGYTATREIRHLERKTSQTKTPILALTAHALKEHEQKSLNAGCDGHLTKPIKKKALLKALEEHTAS